jgi:hypothetical protein
VAVFLIRQMLRDAEMLNLRVLEHLVDRVDWAAGTPAALSSLTQVSVDFFSVSLPILAFSASRFFERAGAVA